MIVDGLTYVGNSRFGWGTTPEHLVRALDDASIDRAIVCPCQPRDHRLNKANDLVAAAVNGASPRLVGLTRIDPLQGENAVIEVSRSVARGLKGIFLHPWEDSFSLNGAEVEAVVGAAADLELPVVIAAGYPWVSEAQQICQLAGKFSSVTFVATNGGQINISGLGQLDAESLVRRCPNVVLLTNGVYRNDFIEGIIESFGAQRIAFASSYPLMNMGYERRRVDWVDVPGESRAAVLGGTLAQMYGLVEQLDAPSTESGAP